MNPKPITYGDVSSELADSATVNAHMYGPQPSMPTIKPSLLRDLKLQTLDDIGTLQAHNVDALNLDLNINPTDVIPPEQLHGFTRLREENKIVGSKMRGRGELLKDIKRRVSHTSRGLKSPDDSLNEVMAQSRLEKYKETLLYIVDKNNEYDKSLSEGLETLARYDDRMSGDEEFSQAATAAYNLILAQVPMTYHPKQVSPESIEAMRAQLSEDSMSVARQLRALEEEINKRRMLGENGPEVSLLVEELPDPTLKRGIPDGWSRPINFTLPTETIDVKGKWAEGDSVTLEQGPNVSLEQRHGKTPRANKPGAFNARDLGL